MKNKIYIAIICAFSIVFAVSSGFLIKHYYDSAKQAEMYDNLIGVVETEPEETKGGIVWLILKRKTMQKVRYEP